MIMCTINIRGLGEGVKRRTVKSLVRDNGLDFFAIQETKLELVDDRMCRSLWGNDGYGWYLVSSSGRSGGILSLWDGALGKNIFPFSGFGFAGVCLEWGVQATRCFIVNVYAKSSIADKRRMWSELLMSKRALVGMFGACLEILMQFALCPRGREYVGVTQVGMIWRLGSLEAS